MANQPICEDNKCIRSVFLLSSLTFLYATSSTHAFNWRDEAEAKIWSEGHEIIDAQARHNVYSWDSSTFPHKTQQGFLHTLKYPVDVSGILIPEDPFLKNISSRKTPFRNIIEKLSGQLIPFTNIDEFFNWLGLVPFAQNKKPQEIPSSFPMGAGILHTHYGRAISFSCSSCHAAELFGKSIVGLPNKGSRANRFFILAKHVIPKISPLVFQKVTQANSSEKTMYARTRNNVDFVESSKPSVLGLDTSLSHVGLSLANRTPNAWADKDPAFAKNPSHHELRTFNAESKPGTWWLLKYKNKWLSDGSVLSGNPIATNILWNEIGRGTDLRELNTWMKSNTKLIQELTSFVFSTEAPKWTDFFPSQSIQLASAKRGSKLFHSNCYKCHGRYEKAWEQPNPADPYLTTHVQYHKTTPVIDVGTDPNRYLGMHQLSAQLNRLELSEDWKVRVEPQKGYVPPPLVGIWSRYPYLHNNSVPNLCALMTPPEKRPEFFIQGPAKNSKTDFDQDCVGYPTGNNIPKSWHNLKDAHYFVNSKPGLSNQGHYKMFLNEKGEERYSPQDKKDLLEFLKTL